MDWAVAMNSVCWCCPDCLQQHPTVNNNNNCEGANTLEEIEDIYEFEDKHPLFHMTKALRYHPTYLQSFLEAYTYLMHERGPLPFSHRVYIGIMAVGRHQQHHLTSLLISEFLSYHGDEKWLRGLEGAPQKLQNLDEVNRILAHRPWLLEPAHILKLTRGSRENWSISELTQAIAILVFYHSLVSLVASCGVGFEFGTSGGSGSPNGAEGAVNPVANLLQRRVSLSLFHQEVYGIDLLLQRMKLAETENSDDFTHEERLARFKDVERQSINLLEPLQTKQQRRRSQHRSPSPSSSPPPTPSPYFTGELEFCYEDFAIQMTKMPNLQPYPVSDYSWETRGYVVAETYYDDSAPCLDAKFRIAKTLTYNKVGTYPNVDTTTFRTAIWNYTQCMVGMMHDDYDYELTNTLLEKNLRSYIKAVTCFPETVTRASYEAFMKDLLPSEKVHINIMIHEAKFQAELLYGFRTIEYYMASDC